MNLYNQKQLNDFTKRLFWATFLLFGVTALQFYRELSGNAATKSLLQNLATGGIYIMLIVAGLKLLESFFGVIKKLWRNRNPVMSTIRDNLQRSFMIKPFVKHVIIILLILIIVPPYATLLLTDLHEKAHLKKYAEYGICGSSDNNFYTAIPDFFNRLLKKRIVLGEAGFCDEPAKQRYLSLSKQEKSEVNLAGIKSDLNIGQIVSLLLLLSITLIVPVIILIKNSYRKSLFLIYCCVAFVILSFILLQIISSTLLNLTSPQSDLQVLLSLI